MYYHFAPAPNVQAVSSRCSLLPRIDKNSNNRGSAMTQAIKLETVSLLRQPPKWRPSPLHRAAKIRSYFRLLKEHGLPSERLVAGTDLPVDVDADPDRMIRVDQYYRVVDNLLVA